LSGPLKHKDLEGVQAEYNGWHAHKAEEAQAAALSSVTGDKPRRFSKKTFTDGLPQYAVIYLTSFLLVAFCVLFISDLYGLPLLQSLLATVLFYVCLYPTVRYFGLRESGLPFLPVLGLSYAVQFALPIFTREPSIQLVNGIAVMSDSDTITALLLSIIGVSALEIGYYLVRTDAFTRTVPCLDLHLNERKAVGFSITALILIPLIISFKDLLPEQIAQQVSSMFTLLQSQVLVAIAILSWVVYSGRGAWWHRVLLYGSVCFFSMRGISSGFVEQATVPLIVLFVTKWLYDRRLPIYSIVLFVALILFLSPAKMQFRQTAWIGSTAEAQEDESSLEKAALWVGEASEYWRDSLAGRRDIASSTAAVSSRTDLIHQFVLICSQTPSVIPYQYGSTYEYFLTAFIPRIIWPDKPEAGGANSFFAVSYGLTTIAGARRSTFGMSLLGESYINFGLYGVVSIMMLQGLILGFLQHVFAERASGAGGQAIFLAFFVFFLNGVGTSAEIFFGNIVQNLICSCVLLWWAREPLIRRTGAALHPIRLDYRLQ
jgi:hypothetical protein